MKTSVNIMGGNTALYQTMYEECKGQHSESDGSETFFFESMKDAVKALEEYCKKLGYAKNRAMFLPGVKYIWRKIHMADIEKSDLLQKIY